MVTDAAAEDVTAVVDPKVDWQLSKEVLRFLDARQDTVFLLERISLSAAFLAFSLAFFFAASSLTFLSSAFFLAAASYSVFCSLSLLLLPFSFLILIFLPYPEHFSTSPFISFRFSLLFAVSIRKSDNSFSSAATK